jgi:hypothetical protein
MHLLLEGHKVCLCYQQSLSGQCQYPKPPDMADGNS